MGGKKKKKDFIYSVLIIMLESVQTTKRNITIRLMCDTQIHNIHHMRQSSST